MVSYITEENKRRKKRRIVFMKHFFESTLLALSMEEVPGKKFSRNYTQWTQEMDSALLDVFVEHHNNGDRAQNGWKSHVYRAAIKAVREKCGVDVTKEKIVSRLKFFDKHYEIVSKILSQSEFGWDWKRMSYNLRVMKCGKDMWRLMKKQLHTRTK
ncbi:hypothetical protein QYE76_031341 [Lolium multiflorum]|uniref:Myb/SANT-like domain-containing protein n=1 Tax=Lolium multiflorum TaxID=4521 RepID=A0AAD8VK86_LOLMU|nr:hypothetical protein QYE76_031341 [Lolium multiflorum]